VQRSIEYHIIHGRLLRWRRLGLLRLAGLDDLGLLRLVVVFVMSWQEIFDLRKIALPVTEDIAHCSVINYFVIKSQGLNN
jgi:hypothetical protein